MLISTYACRWAGADNPAVKYHKRMQCNQWPLFSLLFYFQFWIIGFHSSEGFSRFKAVIVSHRHHLFSLILLASRDTFQPACHKQVDSFTLHENVYKCILSVHFRQFPFICNEILEMYLNDILERRIIVQFRRMLQQKVGNAKRMNMFDHSMSCTMMIFVPFCGWCQKSQFSMSYTLDENVRFDTMEFVHSCSLTNNASSRQTFRSHEMSFIAFRYNAG